MHPVVVASVLGYHASWPRAAYLHITCLLLFHTFLITCCDLLRAAVHIRYSEWDVFKQ